MARYSNWDWNRRSYAVYEDGQPAPVMGEPRRCQPTARPGVGGMIDVNRTLCVLPAGARQISWSDVAVGEVVQLPGSGGSGVRPGLGGGMLFAPGGGVGAAPSGGLGFSFQEAVVVNVLVSIVSGLITTFVFKKVLSSGADVKPAVKARSRRR